MGWGGSDCQSSALSLALSADASQAVQTNFEMCWCGGVGLACMRATTSSVTAPATV